MSSSLEYAILGTEADQKWLPLWLCRTLVTGTWTASQGPHELHLLSHLGGLDPIVSVLTIASSSNPPSLEAAGSLVIVVPSAMSLAKVKLETRRNSKETSSCLFLWKHKQI